MIGRPIGLHQNFPQQIGAQKMRHARTLAVAALIAAMATMVAWGQGGNQNPGVIPPNAKYKGLSYAEWEAKWWQAVFAIPVGAFEHPFFTAEPFGGEDGVTFLVGLFGEGNVKEITLPAGTALFFPIINASCSVFEPDPFHGDDEQSLRECANGHIDGVSDVFAVIDGKPVNNIQAYRVESPLFEWGPLPDDNIFQFFGLDAPEGTTSLAVDAGYYLLLAPLNVGEHVISFGGMFGDGSVIDTTYLITVVPK
jgi:hypothetical protein